MTVSFGTRQHLTLVKVETTPGTDPTPTPAANALRTTASPVWRAELEPNDTNTAQNSIDAGAPIPGGGRAMATGDYFLTGAGTAGIAADWGVLMKAASMTETLTAADITDTSQAVSANTVTLDAAESATDDVYKGMVLSGVGGFYAGQDRVITAYNGTTKVATVYPDFTGTPTGTPDYTIRANARYSPLSQGAANVTLYGYKHGLAASSNSKLRQILGAMANLQIGVTTKKLVTLGWSISGQLPAAPTDVSHPATPTFVGATPESFRNAACYLNGVAVKMNSLTFDFGNQVRSFDDPAQAFGNDTAAIPARTMAGRMQLAMSYTSSLDILADFIAATSRPIWLSWGSAYGKKVSIYIPAAQYTGPEEVDINGFAGQGVPFQAVGTDSGIYIAAY